MCAKLTTVAGKQDLKLLLYSVLSLRNFHREIVSTEYQKYTEGRSQVSVSEKKAFILSTSIHLLLPVHRLQSTYLELGLWWPSYNHHPHFRIWGFSWSNLEQTHQGVMTER